MQVLKFIKSEHVIALDIETVRVAEKFLELDEGTQGAWEYKNKQDGEIPEVEQLEDLWIRASSLYAEFSKVCAISIAFMYEGQLFCKEFYGPDEKQILQDFAISLDKISAEGKKNGVTYRLAGHASKYFDFPFLCKRFIINGMDIPVILDSTALKPWEQVNLCTNELWKVGGTGAGSSLQALCNVLQLPVSKVDLVGDEVGAAYYKEEYERIGRYCSYDTVATFNVIRKLKKESIFDFDNVTYVAATGVTEEKKTLLDRIFESGQINPDDVESIIDYCKSKTEKEKEAIKTIILSALKKDIKMIDVDEKELFNQIAKA